MRAGCHRMQRRMSVHRRRHGRKRRRHHDDVRNSNLHRIGDLRNAGLRWGARARRRNLLAAVDLRASAERLRIESDV